MLFFFFFVFVQTKSYMEAQYVKEKKAELLWFEGKVISTIL